MNAVESIVVAIAVLMAGAGNTFAQSTAAPLGQERPTIDTKEAAPGTAHAMDGVRNGSTKEERDQHNLPRQNPVTPGTTGQPPTRLPN